ncbi:unnamed protein product [Kuraishia capsulata CBS 1993]|uniref:UspA domain-containing protein n=1 Tax=Kuraishia capsulata CBS 1993 TaxID=1382522 RepID=W6MP70_9ASCO|nr:uncharacterized protein KUCA_T00004457001 [Kuraishia capsulata CBS 1993]CDK28474.1 unnamed protein product [Kuraishia capsulata CBS 1993]
MEQVQEPVVAPEPKHVVKTIDISSILPAPTYLPSISSLNLNDDGTDKDSAADGDETELDETSRNTRLNALLYDKAVADFGEDTNFPSSRTELRSASPSVYTASGQLLSPSLKPAGSAKKPAHIRPDMFEVRIMFETLSAAESSNLTLTLKTRHKDFRFSRISRTWLCGYDENECSLVALKWAVDEMMDDGDTIVCLRVLDKHPDEVRKAAEKYKRESSSIMDEIISQNVSDKAISIVFELSVGKVPKMIEKAISDYDPSILIVGTRGIQKTKFKDAFITPKSMSKYCLQFSSIPVIVVNPWYVSTPLNISANNSSVNLTDENPIDDLSAVFKERLENYVTSPIGTPTARPLLAHQDSSGSISHISLDSSVEPRSRLSKFRRALSPAPSPSQSPLMSPSDERALSPVRSRGMSPGGSLLPRNWLKKKTQSER